jgi:hypothetical protein
MVTMRSGLHITVLHAAGEAIFLLLVGDHISNNDIT